MKLKMNSDLRRAKNIDVTIEKYLNEIGNHPSPCVRRG